MRFRLATRPALLGNAATAVFLVAVIAACSHSTDVPPTYASQLVRSFGEMGSSLLFSVDVSNEPRGQLGLVVLFCFCGVYVGQHVDSPSHGYGDRLDNVGLCASDRDQCGQPSPSRMLQSVRFQSTPLIKRVELWTCGTAKRVRFAIVIAKRGSTIAPTMTTHIVRSSDRAT